IVPLRLPSCDAVICTTIRFLGWAPGSRVPSQFATIGCVSAAIAKVGTILNPSISVNPTQSTNDDTRGFFTVDLLSPTNLLLTSKTAPSIDPSRTFADCSRPHKNGQ